MKFRSDLYKSAGLNSTDIANLFGVSRVTGYRWLKGTDRAGDSGVGVNIFLQERVAAMDTAVERALKQKRLPDAEMATLAPDERAARLNDILDVVAA